MNIKKTLFLGVCAGLLFSGLVFAKFKGTIRTDKYYDTKQQEFVDTMEYYRDFVGLGKYKTDAKGILDEYDVTVKYIKVGAPSSQVADYAGLVKEDIKAFEKKAGITPNKLANMYIEAIIEVSKKK